MLFDSIQAVLSILIMMGVGFVLSKTGWINGQNKQLLLRLVANIAVPCTIFNSFVTSFDREALINSGASLFVPAVAVTVLFIAGRLTGKYLLKLKKGRLGIFSSMASCPNTIFIGLPVITALFAEKGIPSAMLYFMCTTALFWTVGAACIQKDGCGIEELSTAVRLKRLISVNIVVIIIAITVVICGIKPPSLILGLTKQIGGIATPLSLMFSGNALYDVVSEYGLKGMRIDKDTAALFVFRFLISPALVLLICMLAGISGITRTVFVLMSAMPAMTQTVIVSGKYGADKEFAALNFFWTTMVSMAVIPVLMAVSPLFG